MSMKQQYGQPKDNYHAKIVAKSAVIFAVCVLLTLICLVPIYILIVNSTHSNLELVANPSQFFFGTHLGENIKTILNDVGDDASKVVKRTAKQYSGAFNVGQG